MSDPRGVTRLAVIGLGHRSTAMIGSMQAVDPGVSIRAVADPDTENARRRLAMVGPTPAGARVDPSADAMLADPADYDGVVIGTRCHLHTTMAIKVASAGLPLFLEKPVAISLQELGALREAFRGREDEVVVSFPLRYTPLFSKALEVVRSGVLGTINQIQAVNNVPYGGVYFGQWYRNHDQTGGPGCRKPPTISTASTCSPEAVPGASPRWSRAGSTAERNPTTSGARPAARPRRARRARRTSPAGETTAVCTRTATTGPTTGVPSAARYRTMTPVPRSSCTRTVSTPATARTSSRAAYRRGTTVIGYEATLEFDLAPMELRIIHHRSEKIEQLRVDVEDETHGGGDSILAENFLDLLKGRARPDASLKDGLLSAAMCLAARESARTKTFQRVGGGAPFPNTR